MALALPAWVAASFYAAEAGITLILVGLVWMGVPFSHINDNVLQSIFALMVYAGALALTIGVPWWIKKLRNKTSLSDLGYHRPPSWVDLVLLPPAYVFYIVLSSIIIYFVMTYVPGFNAGQTQDTGFTHLGSLYQYILALIVLVILAPVAEETLFRGYLFGKLRKYVPTWVAILVTSALFGAVHGQWNVGLDVFVMSVVSCCLRLITGNLWVSTLLHMAKNGVAYYILFISPLVLIH